VAVALVVNTDDGPLLDVPAGRVNVDDLQA
jgi:hypothetical protein